MLQQSDLKETRSPNPAEQLMRTCYTKHHKINDVAQQREHIMHSLEHICQNFETQGRQREVNPNQ